jgi:pyruvate dehydrogenase E2 component (dihydrolipoamide acetyltransferase)
MTDFLMPSLGADMEAGTLVEWLKQPGDPVIRGEAIAVVETQKGAIEIEVFETGTLAELLVQTGETVPVGTPLARILRPGQPAAPPQAVAASAPPMPRTVPPLPAAALSPAPAARAQRPLASPAARRAAEARGVDLGGIKGTGPRGAVISSDVPAGPAQREPRKPGLDLVEMRKAIAAAMSRSKREIPHYYLATDIDLTTVSAWLTQVNATLAPDRRILLSAVLVKAVALALRRAPAFNGFFRDGALRTSPQIHVGMAVALRGGGLIAPAIHDTDALSLPDLMAAMRDLIERTRNGRLRNSELTDPTITVTALGERGIDCVFGVIFPPQVAILGFGRPQLRARVVDDAVQPRQVLTASLAADHRVSDGHAGGLLLANIERLLQEPGKL